MANQREGAMAERTSRDISAAEFLALFDSGQPVRIMAIAPQLNTTRSTTTRLMRRHATLTSINYSGAFCVLPGMCRFDSLGFCSFGGIRFFRDGNQLASIVHLVNESDAGLGVGEINSGIGAKAAMQSLNLVRARRLQRRKNGRHFIYLAADAAIADKQIARREAIRQESQKPVDPQQQLEDYLTSQSRDNVELLVKILVLCLQHPQFSASRVAALLIRRGEQTCVKQIKDLMERFAHCQKNF